MHTRLRLLRGATALLYFGPLLAGLGGFGWNVVPVFAAIFLLWLVILRPHLWPKDWADWAKTDALVALAAQSAVQLLLVTVCFGIGRGIGGVLGALPAFPLMLPIAISFLSIPLCRMIWNPDQAARFDSLLDEALQGLTPIGTMEPPISEEIRQRTGLAARLVAELGNLPESTPDGLLVQHLQAMATQVEEEDLRVALMDPIYDGSAHPLHWRAAILHATDPAVAGRLMGTTYPLSLFHELRETEHMRLFAFRCRTLIGELPEAVPDCPEVDAILSEARAFPAAQQPLSDLAAAISRVAAGRDAGAA